MCVKCVKITERTQYSPYKVSTADLYKQSLNACLVDTAFFIVLLVYIYTLHVFNVCMFACLPGLAGSVGSLESYHV